MDINLVNQDIYKKLDNTCKLDIFDKIYDNFILFIKKNIKISLFIFAFIGYVIIINIDKIKNNNEDNN